MRTEKYNIKYVVFNSIGLLLDVTLSKQKAEWLAYLNNGYFMET